MSAGLFVTVFSTVFLAELGDKTQLATVLFSSGDSANKYVVFLAASSALVLSSAIAVLAGGFIGQHVSAQTLSYVAGIGFIAIGLWTIWSA